MKNGNLQQGNYASLSNDRNEQLFVMKHMLSLVMIGKTTCSNDVWYVDLGASNHMTSHAEWFKALHNLKRPSYVETWDDTTHPIVHIGKVPLFMQDGQTKYLGDVLDIPNINKNLVFMV